MLVTLRLLIEQCNAFERCARYSGIFLLFKYGINCVADSLEVRSRPERYEIPQSHISTRMEVIECPMGSCGFMSRSGMDGLSIHTKI